MARPVKLLPELKELVEDKAAWLPELAVKLKVLASWPCVLKPELLRNDQ